MPTLRLKTSGPSAPSEFISDLGLEVPGSGNFVEFNEAEEIRRAVRSEDLRDALTSGSVVVVDMSGIPSDVPTTDALAFLDVLLLPDNGPYGALIRDRDGVAPIVPAIAAGLAEIDSLGVSSTTLATYQTKLTLTSADFDTDSGVFVNFHFAVVGTQNGTNIQWRVVKDIGEASEEVLYEETHVGVLSYPVTPFSILVLTGVHTFTLQWRRSSGGGSAQIFNATAAAWRLE